MDSLPLARVSRFLGALFVAWFMSGDTIAAQSNVSSEQGPALYVVNFTAEWCPNCKILDPALEKALASINVDKIKHVKFDLTDELRSAATFDKVNGTILAGVYGDYLGVTGLVVMVAADSGEKIDCATRLVNAEAIALSIEHALTIVQTKLAGTRETESILCPPANRKIAVPT